MLLYPCFVQTTWHWYCSRRTWKGTHLCTSPQQKCVRMRRRAGGKSPSATRRRTKNRKMDISEPPASLVNSTTEAAKTSGLEMNMNRVENIERMERGTREVDKLEISTKEQDLVVDVIPTSAHQRCYSTTVAIRGTYEQQVGVNAWFARFVRHPRPGVHIQSCTFSTPK